MLFRKASPSVLRIEPQLGYVKGNVIVVSAKAARDPLARTLLFKALKIEPRGEVVRTHPTGAVLSDAL